MTNYELYLEMNKTLKVLSSTRNIPSHELVRYYTKPKVTYVFSEKFDSILYVDSNGIPFIFAKMLFHVQDTPLLSKIMEFNDKYSYFSRLTGFFFPQRFLEKYTPYDAFGVMKNHDGHIYRNLCDYEKENTILNNFIDKMFACANYLKEFSSESDVVADIESHNASRAELINYFVEKGFGVDFSCRFLNAFINSIDLPQITPHLKDVIAARCGRKRRFYNSKEGEIELIRDVTFVVEDINKTLVSQMEKPITVFQFERMVTLVCTGKFYLHKNSGSKGSFIKRINA